MNRFFRSFFVVALGVVFSAALLTGSVGCASSKCCGKCVKTDGQTASKCKAGCKKPCCKKVAKGKCPPGCTKPCCKKT